MRSDAPTRVACACAIAAALAGCAIATPIGEQHPSVQRAPPTPEDTEESRRGTALQTAAGDLACQSVELVLVLHRRYANGAAARYVIEGCGKRALYAETCADYPRCRYLMVSLVPTTPAHAAPPSPEPPPPSNAPPPEIGPPP